MVASIVGLVIIIMFPSISLLLLWSPAPRRGKRMRRISRRLREPDKRSLPRMAGKARVNAALRDLDYNNQNAVYSAGK